jgi:hypothetical protein
MSSVRKQYHSRLSDGRRLIWDVDRLMGLALNLPIKLVLISQIEEIDEAYWFQASDPPPTCRAVIEHAKLIEAADLEYPIILCPQGRVMDGMHRVARAALMGMQSIRARQFPEMPKPDYIDTALESLPYDVAGQR